MYSAKSFQLHEDEFNYLLPAIRPKLLQKGDRYYFISYGIDCLDDMLCRLKGLYENYDDELPNMCVYYCSKEGTINYFRKSINNSKS
jgi:hypothetical protein